MSKRLAGISGTHRPWTNRAFQDGGSTSQPPSPQPMGNDSRDQPAAFKRRIPTFQLGNGNISFWAGHAACSRHPRLSFPKSALLLVVEHNVMLCFALFILTAVGDRT